MREYAYIWEFEVAPEKRAAFEQQYGPTGAWAALFKRSPDYLDTLLLRDKTRPQRYLTIDRWRNEEAFRRFRHDYDTEYREIDRTCEGLAAQETKLGEYTR